ncbi:MAG: hypothetical protein ACRDO1_12220 [Nocardioidaceae bacterium]
MFAHPEIILTLAHNHQQELISQAERHNLLATVRRSRRSRGYARGGAGPAARAVAAVR